MRTYLAATSVALLLLAGCTSGDDDAAVDGSETTKASETTLDPAEAARAPGVTEDTIKLGITYVDLEAVRDVTDIEHGDYEAAYRAVIDDINANGGINGRMIEPVFAAINPRGTEAAEAACLQMSQDEHVFAVLGFFLGENALCLVDTQNTIVIGGSMSEETLSRAQAPWYTWEAGSDRVLDIVRQFAESGELDGDVAVFAAPFDESLLQQSVEPLLEELGIEPVETAILDAPPDDLAANIAQGQVIAQRFEAAGATKVLIVGDAGLQWATAMENTDYRPQLLLTANSSLLAYSNDPAGRDLSVLEDAISGGFYGPPTVEYNEPKMQDCLAVLDEAGYETIDPADLEDPGKDPYTAARTACISLTVFKAIAEAAGDDLNYATFRAAADGLEIEVPGQPEPFAYGPPPSADGDAPVYLYEWDPTEKEFALRED